MGLKIDTNRFRVRPDTKVRLHRWSTRIQPLYESKSEYRERLAESTQELSDLQERLYASNTWSLLVIFQAMDTAGKDGAIRHVLSGVNPQGCQVASFKAPGPNELEHDFLWRTTLHLPERGRIGLFNRSYYEEVLVVRVHPEYLAPQGLPKSLSDPKAIWSERYESITDHERHLTRNGTRIVKFFLHLSKQEQRRRLLARTRESAKHWKLNAGDLRERALWKDYMRAYEMCLSGTSTKHAPWYIVPADDKLNARLIVSRVIVTTLKSLNVDFPAVDAAQKKEVARMRKILK